MPKRPMGRKPGEWTAVTPEEIRAFREKHEISRSRLAGALGEQLLELIKSVRGALK